MMIVNHAGELHLSNAGEADEVRADTEASALTSRHTDRRGDEVKHSKDSRSDDGEGDNLLEINALPGNNNSSKAHSACAKDRDGLTGAKHSRHRGRWAMKLLRQHQRAVSESVTSRSA